MDFDYDFTCCDIEPGVLGEGRSQRFHRNGF